MTTPSSTSTVVPIHSSTPTSTHQRYRKCLPYCLINFIKHHQHNNHQPTLTYQHRPRAPPLLRHLQRPPNCLPRRPTILLRRSHLRGNPSLRRPRASSSSWWDYVGSSSGSARAPAHGAGAATSSIAFTTPAGESGRLIDVDGPVGANARQVGSYRRLARRRKVR
jgi:hypothetical protein